MPPLNNDGDSSASWSARAGTRQACPTTHAPLSQQDQLLLNMRTWLMRDDVTYRISNVILTDPDPPQLKSMKKGDSITIRCGRAKCDQWVEVHAHFPWEFTFDDCRYNVAAAIRDLELMYPCRGSDRSHTALFGNDAGSPYEHNTYSAFLRGALTHLYGAQVASLYTWHSYRAGLATALHAAGTSDEVIMLICHWKNPESLRSYRRLSQEEHDAALRSASRVPVTLLQPQNAPVVSGDQHYAALLDEIQRTPSSLSSTAPNPQAAPPNAAAPAGTPSERQQVHISATARLYEEEWHSLRVRPRNDQRVLVKRDTWPSYSCNEQGGKGWEGTVRSATGTSILVRFTYAQTHDGRAYADVRLPYHQVLTLQAPLRGGCAHGKTNASKYTPPEIGAPNENGYPQLVASNTCALCKRPLSPLAADRLNWQRDSLPTRVATPERLQCERCGRVRYCSAWCAHIHYWACHRHICPLPAFDSAYTAEYVLRRGHVTSSFPIRCIDAQLLGNGTYKTPPNLQARAHVWTTVPHRGTRLRPLQCTWCTQRIRPHAEPQRHDLWFVGLITRIRQACDPPQNDTPRWAPPLTIYASCPPCSGEQNWPRVHHHARHIDASHFHRAEYHPLSSDEGAGRAPPAQE